MQKIRSNEFRTKYIWSTTLGTFREISEMFAQILLTKRRHIYSLKVLWRSGVIL